MKGLIMTTAELFADILAVDADANAILTAEGVFRLIDDVWTLVYGLVPVALAGDPATPEPLHH